MLSRIADSLYWMSRQLERAECTARLVEINLIHAVEAEAMPEEREWRPLLSICGKRRSTQASAARRSRARVAVPARSAQPGSVRTACARAENARGARPHLEGDVEA
jgi:uncharacterized alpha-E superfamily protein